MKNYLNHVDRFQRIPWERTGWKNWVQKLLGKQEAPDQTQNQSTDQDDLLWQISSSSQEFDTHFSLDCKNATLFVERSEKDKDTDKDVDAYRVRTGWTWWQMVSRNQDTLFSKEWVHWVVEYQRRAIETQSTTLGNIVTSIFQWISVLSTEQSQSGAKRILERQVVAELKVLANHHQIKQDDFESQVMFEDYTMLRETECIRVWKIQFLKKTKLNISVQRVDSFSDRGGNHFVTTIVEDDWWRKRTSMCKEHTAPRNRTDSSHAHQLMQTKKLVQSSIFGFLR